MKNMLNLTEKQLNRYKRKIDISTTEFWNGSPCWNWTASLAKGYGQYVVNGKRILSHRAAWMLEYGEISSEILVLHRCDNPVCCNTKHLFLGTIQDNMKDKIKKGRQAKGENHGSHTHPEIWANRKKSK